jgi:integrase/recombinase XerD
MEDLIEAYYKAHSLTVQADTAARARLDLGNFARSLARQGLTEIGSLTREHLEAWREGLLRRGIKSITFVGYKATVRRFLRWMYHEGYLIVNPYPEEWDQGRREIPYRRAPSEDEAKYMLERIAERSHCPLRDRAILELAYGSGLRRAELHRLNLADLRGDWIWVRGKGGAERLVPLGAEAKAHLKRYIATERMRKVERYNPHEEALFVSWLGARLGIQSYSYLVSRHRGEGNDITLHSFRHACATHMLARGARVGLLQKLLGHRKLSTTQIYAQVNTESLKAVLDEYHPRG